MNIKQRLTLSDEQKRVLQMVVEEGKNVFFTGSAGMSLVQSAYCHDTSTRFLVDGIERR